MESSAKKTKEPDNENGSQEAKKPAQSKKGGAASSSRKDATKSLFDGGIQFNKDVIIQPNSPIEHLNKEGILAFKAQGSGNVASDLFALICERHLTPRASIANKYASIINPDMAKIVASGKVKWTDKKEYYCFVFEDVLGNPLVKRTDLSPALGWKPEMVLQNVIKPLIHVLMDLRDKDIVHGEIWPGNIFDGGSSAKDKIKLGECLSAPASALLPSLYEPIERAMATPLGRGLGTSADDLYSFGVSLAVILRTMDPMEGASEEEIIISKIERGTYTTLIGKDRFSGAVLELLRGLLYDDPMQRWGFDEIQAWLDGRRLSPKQSPKRIKANRPLEFNENKYIRPELLAKDLSKNPLDSVRIMDSGDLTTWIERAIEDKSIKARVEPALHAIPSSRGDSFANKVAARIGVALNPDMPIRYKELSFTPEGFGKCLTAAYIQKKDLQPYVEVIKGLFTLQIIRQKNLPDMATYINRFDSVRAFITQAKMGSGIERCIYLLDPDSPCLSPLLEDYYVQSPEDLVRALNDIAEQKNNKSGRILDRHMVAFLSVKDRKNVDPYMIELGAEEGHKQAMGEARALATIQKRSQLEELPALASWLSHRFDPIYERFHDRNKRESLKAHVHKIASAGDLAKIAYLFEDEHLYENDFYTFKQAMEEYQTLEREKQIIEKKLQTKKGFGLNSGRQIASFIALFLSIILILITAFQILSVEVGM